MQIIINIPCRVQRMQINLNFSQTVKIIIAPTHTTQSIMAFPGAFVCVFTGWKNAKTQTRWPNPRPRKKYFPLMSSGSFAAAASPEKGPKWCQQHKCMNRTFFKIIYSHWYNYQPQCENIHKHTYPHRNTNRQTQIYLLKRARKQNGWCETESWSRSHLPLNLNEQRYIQFRAILKHKTPVFRTAFWTSPQHKQIKK